MAAWLPIGLQPISSARTQSSYIIAIGLNRRTIQFNPGRAAWLFHHLIRSHQHIRWNGQADLLGGFQIDDELEFNRSLNG